MFKKENRLSTNFEFNITRKYGSKYQGDSFYFYALKPTNYEGPSKIGFVVSNKIDDSAPKRNRLKRLFREAFKPHFQSFPQNYWVVVHPKSTSLEKSYEEICADVNQVLSKVSFS